MVNSNIYRKPSSSMSCAKSTQYAYARGGRLDDEDALPQIQMMKQKLREVKELPQVTAWKWWSCHSSPGLSASNTQVTSHSSTAGLLTCLLLPSVAKTLSSSPQAFTKTNLILDALPSAHGDGEMPGADGELEHWTSVSEFTLLSLITASMALGRSPHPSHRLWMLRHGPWERRGGEHSSPWWESSRFQLVWGKHRVFAPEPQPSW